MVDLLSKGPMSQVFRMSGRFVFYQQFHRGLKGVRVDNTHYSDTLP